MSRHDDFMDDPAFQRAADAVGMGLALVAAHHNDDPDAANRLVAMCVLVAFANADGLAEPHSGILAGSLPTSGWTTARTLPAVILAKARQCSEDASNRLCDAARADLEDALAGL